MLAALTAALALFAPAGAPVHGRGSALTLVSPHPAVHAASGARSLQASDDGAAPPCISGPCADEPATVDGPLGGGTSTPGAGAGGDADIGLAAGANRTADASALTPGAGAVDDTPSSGEGGAEPTAAPGGRELGAKHTIAYCLFHYKECETHTTRETTAQCLSDLGVADLLWLTAPASPGEHAARALVLGLCALCVVGMLALVYRQRDNEPRKAALLLVLALLSSTDGYTDIVLASQWLRCSHPLWAFITMGCVVGSTAVASVAAIWHWRKRAGHVAGLIGAASALLQLAPVFESVATVAQGKHTDLKPGDISEENPVFRLKLAEVIFEAAPQMYLQSFVLLYVGVEFASPLAWLSLAVSVAGLSNLLGELNQVRMEDESMAGALAARAFALCGAVCRALAIALFACAFHDGVYFALVLAYFALVLIRMTIASGSWEDAQRDAVLLGPMPGMAPKDAPYQLPAQAWLMAVEGALVGCALALPSAWRAAQPAAVLTVAGCVFGVVWLGQLVAFYVLYKGRPGCPCLTDSRGRSLL